MTRVTDFGRKRTYLQAGFEAAGTTTTFEPVDGVEDQVMEGEKREAGDGEPVKKKRKRVRKKKPKTVDAREEVGGEREEGGGTEEAGEGDKRDPSSSRKALKKRKWKEREKEKKQRRLVSSEMRRQKRIQERDSETTCFACREKGHAARDCPKLTTTSGGSSGGVQGKVVKGVVGICYRCGSTRHSLSKCKKPVDESDPLPFASCFVCNGKGHLASSCPQNVDKGIYPNGGCCKLCREKTHLAKDCELRRQDTTALIGTAGHQPGADEDDFHTFKRQELEVEREEDKAAKMLQANNKPGSHSNTVESTPKPIKKVVYF